MTDTTWMAIALMCGAEITFNRIGKGNVLGKTKWPNGQSVQAEGQTLEEAISKLNAAMQEDAATEMIKAGAV